MDYSKLNMQLTFFGNFDSLDASSDVITKLFDAFKEEGFLPNTIQVLQVEQPSNKTTVRLRPQLIKANANGEYFINILPDRIDFAINSREKSQVINLFESYVETLKKVMDTFSLNSNRLALTATYQLNGNQEQITKMKDTLLPTFSYYRHNQAIEATAHNVARPLIKLSNTSSEYYNVITDVMFRVAKQGDLNETKATVRFDINTLQENTTNRFDKNNIYPFFHMAYQIIREIVEDLVSTCE